MTDEPAPAVTRFRRDLRLADSPALLDTCARPGDPDVLPLVVLDPALWGPAPLVDHAVERREALARLQRVTR